MTNNKLTQRDYFNAAIAVFNGDESTIPAEDMVKFFEGRIAALDKKKSGGKSAADSDENKAYMEKIAGILAGGERLTVSAIMAKDTELGALSNQKVSALLRMMIANGGYDKAKDKKSTVFFAV